MGYVTTVLILKNVKPNWYPIDEGTKRLNKIIYKIKEDGKDRDFDCLLE